MTSHVVSDDELGWHEAEVAGRPRTSICSMVSAHAASRPDRPAVIDPDGRHLTYRELQRRSGGLAVQLAADGVGPGSCVGVFLERSSEFVVAAYAVMRAGAAYLPLDVATPQDRLEFVLSDAGAEAVISDGRELPAGPWRTIQVDEPIAVPDTHPGLDRSAPDDLAYVIYTSGSTGRPKGVELTHANLANLVDWHVSGVRCRPHGPREPGRERRLRCSGVGDLAPPRRRGGRAHHRRGHPPVAPAAARLAGGREDHHRLRARQCSPSS